MEVVEVAQAVVVVAAQPAPAPVALPAPPVALPVAPVVLHVPPVAPPVAPVVEHVQTDPPVVLTILPAVPRWRRAARTDGATRRPPGRVGPAARRAPARTRNGRTTSYRFVVRFQTEAVLKATDIRDALRQAESLGATEVLALTRNS